MYYTKSALIFRVNHVTPNHILPTQLANELLRFSFIKGQRTIPPKFRCNFKDIPIGYERPEIPPIEVKIFS